MSKETIMQILNTLNLVEVKGYQNINYMCGAMNALQKELNGDRGDNNGVQSNDLDK